MSIVRSPLRLARRPRALLLLVLPIVLLFAAACTPAAPGGEPADTDQAESDQAAAPPETVDGVPSYMVKGDPDAPVTLVEWSDYQCPYCARHSETASKQIDEAYVDSGQIKVVFRDLPLVSIHPFAVKASEAARCAGEIGGSDGYWAMHDGLFATQAEWSQSEDATVKFKALAGEQGLDQAKFDACLDDGDHTAAVEADLQAAAAEGFQATPTFALGGGRIEGAVPFEQFQAGIDTVLAGGSLPTPTIMPTPEMVEVEAPAVEAEVGDAPARGDPNAPVTIIEYSDYQCPYCAWFVGESYPVLIDEFVETGKVYYVFKDFPLVQIHSEAAAAAEASHCARDLGGDEAYWAMHDALFGSQDEWSGNADHQAVFVRLADENGLDGEAIAACLEEGTHSDTVEASFQEAVGIGLTGTPSFVMNGQAAAGVLPPEALRDTIAKLEQGESLKLMMPKEQAEQYLGGNQ